MKIPTDKKIHFAIGTFAGLFCIIEQTILFIIGYLGASAIFIGKEIYDTYKKKKTEFSLSDLVADYAGFLTGTLIRLAFVYLVYPTAINVIDLINAIIQTRIN